MIFAKAYLCHMHSGDVFTCMSVCVFMDFMFYIRIFSMSVCHSVLHAFTFDYNDFLWGD